MIKTKDGERLLRIEEVAGFIGCSTQTINNWYRWKRENPNEELTELLPEPIRATAERGTRYWTYSDALKLADFKLKRPIGRGGLMGTVTQRYVPSSKHYSKYEPNKRK